MVEGLVQEESRQAYHKAILFEIYIMRATSL